MIKLFIDTSSRETISVGIKIGKELFTKKRQALSNASQMLLPLISDLLSEKKLSLRDLTYIEVNIGPGSFTGLRVGVSVANALSYSLSIPVNGSVFAGETLVVPKYF